MLHFGLFDIRTDLFVLLFSSVLVLCQVLLCFKVKKKFIRRIPVYLSLGLLILFTALGCILDGWDSFGFFFLAACSMVLLLSIGLGWGIWAIVRKVRIGKGV